MIKKNPGDTVAVAALRLQTFLASPAASTGLLAELRNMDITAPGLGGLSVVMEMTAASSPAHVTRWLAVARAMALLRPETHKRGARLGAALRQAGMSERRFQRLVTAPQDLHDSLVWQACRMLRAKRVSCNFVEVAQLLLWRDKELYHALCMQLSMDYLRGAPREGAAADEGDDGAESDDGNESAQDAPSA